MQESPPNDRTEQRLSALESAVDEIRDTLAHLARRDREASSAPTASAPGEVRARPMPKPRPQPPGPVKAWLGSRTGSRPDRPRDLETWFGQNALLVVGVLALVAAVAYTLKYAFDQGWISPAARVGAGLAGGLAVAAYGETLIRKGLRRFGAGLQGAGAAIAYLSAWAAAGPFEFVPAGAGIVGLAVISGLVLFSALRTSESYLAGLAAAGAYMAPILLGEGPETGNLLLTHSLMVSGVVAVVGVLRRWPGPFMVAILGFFLMALVAEDAHDAFRALYVTAGGGALIAAALWRNWNVHAVVAWALAWTGVLLGAEWMEGWPAWVLVAGPATLVWPLWRQAMDAGTEFPARIGGVDRLTGGRTLVFYASAAAWALAATEALPTPAEPYPLIAAAVISLAFLLPGLLRGHSAMHLAGLGVLAVGILAQWSGLGIAAGLSALAVFAAVTTRSGSLTENRWSGLALGAMASYALFENESMRRPDDDPALVGRWSVALYVVLASLIAIAGPLWKAGDRRSEAPSGFNLRVWTWLLAALVALTGGTTEIPEFVLQRGGSELAAGLSVSAYWLLLAGALLAYGFWKDVRGVRLTGLAVAALALGKVLVVDLAELQALYRVGSLALLAAITLLGARAYYRRE
jgi:uncharacterized membrane protein